MPTQLGAALVLTEPEIRELLNPAACITAVENAFTSYARGQAELPNVIHLDIPDAQGEIHIKAGYLHAAPWYAVKFASGFPGNPAPRPPHQRRHRRRLRCQHRRPRRDPAG